MGYVERTGARGELRLSGGFRCLDIGNTSAHQRAVHRATLLREQYQHLIQQRVQAQAVLESIVVEQDTLRASDDALLLRFLPHTVPHLARDCIQLALNASLLEDALRKEQTCRIASIQTLRLLVDLVKELSLEEDSSASPVLSLSTATPTDAASSSTALLMAPPPLHSAASSTHAGASQPTVPFQSLLGTSSSSLSNARSAAICFERLENVRLKMSIAAPAVTDAAVCLQNTVPELIQLEHTLMQSQKSEAHDEDHPPAAAASASPATLAFRPLRRRRADAVPASNAVEAGDPEQQPSNADS